MNTVFYVLLIVLVLIAATAISYYISVEGFKDKEDDTSGSKMQKGLVSDLADKRAQGRQDYVEAIQHSDMTGDEQILVNFYMLGCRFAGYLGPFKQGFFAPEAAVTSALKMGCRVFVYEIDYFGDSGDTYPRLVVRNAAQISQSVVQKETDINNDTNSNILEVSKAIANNAFSGASGIMNPNDPVIIVLYVIRDPPRAEGAKQIDYDTTRRTYYSRIAAGLAPLLSRDISTTIDGNYYRQMNESKLLKNSMDTYKQKVLFFSNASTEIFRTLPANVPAIPTNLDLDYIVNLRLVSNQTTFGVTLKASPNSNGGKFGILDSANSYMDIQDKDIESTEKTITNGTWTICFAQDPATIVPETTVSRLQKKLGVHCIPIQMWSSDYDYMFTANYFKTYSFVPKPEPLRVPANVIIVPAPAAPQADSKQGVLATPKV